MPSIPCVSDYRSGDEFNPRSPHYDEPEMGEGSEKVVFPWYFYFDPPHPTLGEEVRAILSGEVSYSDQMEYMSPAERRRMSSEDDGPEVKRTYDGFQFEAAELPDGAKVDKAALLAMPGFGSEKQQFDDLSAELIDHAREAIEKDIAIKREVKALREAWREVRTPSIMVDLGAAAPAKPKP